MAKINTTAIANAVNAALNAVSAYRDAVGIIRKAIVGQVSQKEVRATLLEPVAAYYKVKLVKKLKGEGVTMDDTAKGFEAARKALQRLTQDVMGESGKQRDSVEPTAAMIKAAKELVRICNEYEGAGRLIAAAIATAKAE